MTLHLKRSRITKALADAGRAKSFAEAEARLSAVQVAVVLGADQAATPAGQAAALTTLATAYKCFGTVTLVMDSDVQLRAPAALGSTVHAAARMLGAQIASTPPLRTTHTVLIGDGLIAEGWQLSCWWNRWLSGIRSSREERLGDSRLPFSGIFAGAAAIRQVFASVLAGRMTLPRDVTVSLWEPWSDAASCGPSLFDVPNQLWILGLGHLGQAFVWNLSFLATHGERLAVLQDDQTIGEENEATSLLVGRADIGLLKTRVAARWLEACGWRTEILERRHYGDLALRPADPPYLICGIDRLEPRLVLARHGFGYMIDAGVGHGPVDFENLQIRVIPRGGTTEGLWSPPGARAGDGGLASRPAYADLEQRIGQCGALTLARASVSVPFVGAATGALIIGQAARLASLQPAVQFLQMELGAPEMTTFSGLIRAPDANLGSCPIRLDDDVKRRDQL